MNRRILVVCLLGAVLFVAHRGWSHWFDSHKEPTHAAVWAKAGSGEDVMIDRRFDIGPGGSLDVQVGDADIVVETGSGTETHVQVILEGRNMELARRYFEEQNFSVEQAGQSVRVVTDEERNGRPWQDNGEAQILVLVRIPTQFDVSLATSDGDVKLGDLNGTAAVRTSDGDVIAGDVVGNAVALKTSDGDIHAGALRSDHIAVQTSDGDVRVGAAEGTEIVLQTSDGNIMADQLRGRIMVSTSDGDIQMGRLDGPAVTLKTSDGEIRAEAVSAAQAEVTTSDGNIRLPHMDGPLRASTSSGEIEVFLLKPGQVQLRTTDGNIRVSAPQSLPANVRLRGENVKIASSFMFQGRVEPEEVDGTINGGGPMVEAYAQDGTVFWGEQD